MFACCSGRAFPALLSTLYPRFVLYDLGFSLMGSNVDLAAANVHGRGVVQGISCHERPGKQIFLSGCAMARYHRGARRVSAKPCVMEAFWNGRPSWWEFDICWSREFKREIHHSRYNSPSQYFTLASQL